jgi:hypothetical protein
VRFETTPAFDSDYARLGDEEKRLFRTAVKDFNRACDRFVESEGASRWPAPLLAKKVQGAAGLWEMTWSFAGPDGRATWEWATVASDDRKHRAVLWHREGGQAIFKSP